MQHYYKFYLITWGKINCPCLLQSQAYSAFWYNSLTDNSLHSSGKMNRFVICLSFHSQVRRFCIKKCILLLRHCSLRRMYAGKYNVYINKIHKNYVYTINDALRFYVTISGKWMNVKWWKKYLIFLVKYFIDDNRYDRSRGFLIIPIFCSDERR